MSKDSILTRPESQNQRPTFNGMDWHVLTGKLVLMFATQDKTDSHGGVPLLGVSELLQRS